jgi:hypothetical protein
MSIYDETPEQERARVMSGIVAAWGADLILFGLSIVIFWVLNIQMLGLVLVAALPLTQYIYVIPAIIIGSRRGEHGRVKGLIIGSSVTFLLCAGCYGVFWGPEFFRR